MVRKKGIKIAKIVFFIIFIVSTFLLAFTTIIDFFKIFEFPISPDILSWTFGISMGVGVFWWGLLWTLEKI